MKWLRFLTNEDDTRWEEMAKQEPSIKKAVDILRTASLDPETRVQYEACEKALKDIASVGGDGLREGKKEVAKKMLSKGMEIDLIIEMSELSYAEVIELKDEMNN
ncbi:PD-(D/E)XK nuclease family transposase [Metabacillus fastidiosus]|nr:PD-(D/E)XK nuclease family transposase [Metabacillus fastidiosus]